MAVLTVQKLTPSTGITPSFAAAAGGGDSFPASGQEFVVVKNASGGSINVTVDAPNADNFGITDNAHDLVVAVPAAGERWIRVADMVRFRDVNGNVQLAYSSPTSVTVGVFAP